MKVDTLELTPEGTPPSRFARWCPSCRCWLEHTGCRRCFYCGAAVVRQPKIVKLKAGELRPGVVAEFADPRDRYDPTRELAALRARLRAR